MKKFLPISLIVFVSCATAVVQAEEDAFTRDLGLFFKTQKLVQPPPTKQHTDILHRWNEIAINATGLDHSAGYGQQFGPGRASRAMAIVHVAIFDSDQPGQWRQDPISQIPLALGAHWGECRTFVLQSAQQFRLPPPPDMTSDAYTTAYNEVKAIGGDGVHTTSIRTPEQTFIGIFWGYDGTPSLCAPPRFYNQITVQVADQKHMQQIELARLLVLVNVAMADGAMSAWDSKFHYSFWRPIAGIRESDPGTGITGLGDGNPATIGDENFMPLGAPASNLNGPNFTPPFPAYPSGHATFGGAVFQILRRFYGTDRVPFTLVSDEFNGVTRDNQGNVRPYMPRHFQSFSQAEEENGQSRIYLGIHWSFDKTSGITQGENIGNYVFDHAFQPVHH
jgi:hypothetical protein